MFETPKFGMSADLCRSRGLKLAIMIAAFAGLSAPVLSADPAKGTLGLAITSWYTAVYETKDAKEECPDGFAVDNGEMWLASLPSDERERLTKGGTVEITDQKLMALATTRSPTGENICYHPTLIKDPPMRTVRGKISYGLDLDGPPNKTAKANTCAHQEFVSPDGQPGIDNQWYRVIGCTRGWRSSGYIESASNGELKDGHKAILMEIVGIDNFTKSNDVEVVFYQAADPLVKDPAGTGAILPHASYGVADKYRYATRGKIENGVLTTDPIDIHFPFFGNLTHADMSIRGMRLRLEISPDATHAQGLVAGYYEVDSFWSYISRQSNGTNSGHFSCPALYEAIHRLADGYPDPNTGRCTALSSAFKIEAVSSFIIHPDPTSTRVSQNANKSPAN